WLMNQEWAVSGLEETSSLSSVVTDSSAASCAWSTGRHIWNGQMNQYPDGTKLDPITQVMSGAGVRCGLVTTTRITHATPAGFGTSVFQRDQEDDIAAEYLKSGCDVLMGGGTRHFDPTRRSDKRDLYSEFEKKGFTVVKDRASTLGMKSEKILGLYTSGHLPYNVDWLNQSELSTKVPTLAEKI